MAAKILANIIIAGGTVLFRAASQAYRQAIINGTKAGVASEGVNAARSAAGKQLTLQEAQQILGIEPGATWAQIAKVYVSWVEGRDATKKYDHLYEANERSGSFYLQSKVFRAKERLEQEFQDQGMPTDDGASGSGDASSGGAQQQQQQSGGQ